MKKTTEKTTTTTSKKTTSKKTTSRATNAKSNVKKTSSHVHASIDKSFSLVARNDNRTRVINSQGKGIAIYYGTKVLTVASHDIDVIKILAKKYKGTYALNNNLGSNKHTVKISNYKTVIEVLETVFGKYNSRKNVKAQEKTTEKTDKKTTSKKSSDKKTTSQENKKTSSNKSSKTEKKTVDTSKTNTINSEVLKSIISEVS